MSELVIFKMIAISLIGGVIGYCTNALAIIMLFRPYKEKRLWGVKLPFTPGVIPQDQPKLAKVIGELVGTHLVSDEAIKKRLRDEDFVKSIEKYILENGGKFMPIAILRNKSSEIGSKLVIKLMEISFPRIIRKINIPHIVETKVKGYEAKELETVVYKVSKKHLRYITLLGGFIGVVIGGVQSILLL